MSLSMSPSTVIQTPSERREVLLEVSPEVSLEASTRASTEVFIRIYAEASTK
jgi:hypothetical protein